MGGNSLEIAEETAASQEPVIPLLDRLPRTGGFVK
jgi:hypothetical protein